MLAVNKHAIQERIFRVIPIATHFETLLSLTGHFMVCSH